MCSSDSSKTGSQENIRDIKNEEGKPALGLNIQYICRAVCVRYLGLTEASTQAVTGVLFVSEPLQVPLQTLLGHSHGLKEVCRLSARL